MKKEYTEPMIELVEVFLIKDVLGPSGETPVPDLDGDGDDLFGDGSGDGFWDDGMDF